MIRERSDTEKAAKPDDITDVTIPTVEQVFRQHGYIEMIHGHTHRPARHTHLVDGNMCIRNLLADWPNSGDTPQYPPLNGKLRIWHLHQTKDGNVEYENTAGIGFRKKK